ncbi:hypothetical protein [Photobacterium satsumensis]|uniref:hypothetical protein n=1 Tax=Photobacterium satsumensis TaxID=2910239 RepID=UPI003D0D4243
MSKSITTIILASSMFSAVAFSANPLTLKVTPDNGGAWVQVEKNGTREAGVNITVNNNHEEHYQTSQFGRVYIPSHYNSSRTMTITATDENGNFASTKRFIPVHK